RHDAAIVLDELRVQPLAAEVPLLHEERAHVRAGRVEPRGKSGGTTADDDEIEVGQRRSFPGSSPTLEQLGIPERYLALGDSFTIGTGTTPDRSFPAVLVRLWRESGREVELRNPAVNGYTTDDLIREELPLITAFRPTFATVLIGANDLVAAVRGPEASRDAEQRYARQLVRIFDARRRRRRRAPATGLVARADGRRLRRSRGGRGRDRAPQQCHAPGRGACRVALR